jgi:hypothetical protein
VSVVVRSEVAERAPLASNRTGRQSFAQLLGRSFPPSPQALTRAASAPDSPGSALDRTHTGESKCRHTTAILQRWGRASPRVAQPLSPSLQPWYRRSQLGADVGLPEQTGRPPGHSCHPARWATFGRGTPTPSALATMRHTLPIAKYPCGTQTSLSTGGLEVSAIQPVSPAGKIKMRLKRGQGAQGSRCGRWPL